MKKLDISPITVSLRNPDGTTKEVDYAIKDSLIEILLSPNLKMNAIKLLKQEVLAKKIIDCKGNELLLEDEEYSRLEAALSIVEGLGKNDIEMVHRIVDAETVEPVVVKTAEAIAEEKTENTKGL